MLKHLHQSREEGERLEHSLQARETFVQRLEENLMTCQNDKLALQETFFTLQDQFRALEKVKIFVSRRRMIGVCVRAYVCSRVLYTPHMYMLHANKPVLLTHAHHATKCKFRKWVSKAVNSAW